MGGDRGIGSLGGGGEGEEGKRGFIIRNGSGSDGRGGSAWR